MYILSDLLTCFIIHQTPEGTPEASRIQRAENVSQDRRICQ
jgi:hypothetical protein